MNYFSLLSFSVFVTCIYLGIYALKLDIRSRLNRIFFFMTLASGIWAFGYTFLYPAASNETAWFWYRIASFGWVFAPAIVVHFILYLTHSDLLDKKPWIMAIPFTPAVILQVRAFTGVLAADGFVQGPLGLSETIAVNSPWLWAYFAYNFLCLALSIAFTWRWARRTRMPQKKKQAFFILGSLVATLLLIYTSNILLPVLSYPLFNVHLPLAGAIFIVFVAIFMWVAINKYKLMNISPEIAADEIISKMTDLLILVDADENIIKVNPQALEVLGYGEGDLKGKNIGKIILEDKVLQRFFQMSAEGKLKELSAKTYFITSNSRHIPASVYASIIKDKSGEKVGTVLVGHDMRETIQLKETMIEIAEERNRLKIKSDQFERMLDIAKKMQFHYMPAKSPSPDIAYLYKPVEKVGGDFFDFISFPRSELTGIFLSDVSGMGVLSAFVTSLIKTIILQLAPMIDNPAEFLTYLNDLLLAQAEGNYVSAFYCIYNRNTRTLVYANAGHNQPLVITQNGTEPLKPELKGMPLAVLPNTELFSSEKGYINRKLTLEKGGKLFLYTDGLINAANHKDEDGATFGESRLKEVLAALKDASPQKLVDCVSAELVSYRGKDELDDDVCVICMDVQ